MVSEVIFFLQQLDQTRLIQIQACSVDQFVSSDQNSPLSNHIASLIKSKSRITSFVTKESFRLTFGHIYESVSKFLFTLTGKVTTMLQLPSS